VSGHVIHSFYEAPCITASLTSNNLTLLSSCHFSSFSDNMSSMRVMGDQSASSRFRSLFHTALEDYEEKTRTKLVDHPLCQRLISCDSVESITAVLQEQAHAFRKFRGVDGKVMKSLKTVVHVLHSLSESTLLGEAIGIVSHKVPIRILCPQRTLRSHFHPREQYLRASRSYLV